MKRNENELDLIKRYINQELNDQENTLFEQQITNDATLQDDIEKIKLLQKITARHQLRENIRKIQSEKIEQWYADDANNNIELTLNSKPKVRPIWQYVSSGAVAASVLFNAVERIVN